MKRPLLELPAAGLSERRRRCPAIVLAACLVATSFPTASRAALVEAASPEGETAEVEALNAQAIEKFQAGQYDEAVALFEQAYALNPEPNYLFNIGRVYEEKGDIEQAVEFYERFAKQPKVELEARELAVERLRVLRAVLEETSKKEEEEKEPPPVEAEPSPAPEGPVDDGEKPKQPKLRLAGYALLGVGGAVLVTGAAFGGIASSQSGDLEGLTPLEERDALIEKGKRNALVADAMFITGGVLAITGLVLVLSSLKKKKGSSTQAQLSPWGGARGGGATVRFRF